MAPDLGHAPSKRDARAVTRSPAPGLRAARLDAPTRRWVEAAVGEGARVLRTRRLHGGVASVVQELTVAHASARHRLVLRRSPDRADVPAHDPAREVATEAQVLRALDGRALAPRVIAADPGGEQCGVAALLMTRCPGRPVVAPTRPGPWVRALAEAVRAVRDAGLEGAELDPVAPW